jgi:hypothetical protein
MKVNLIFLHIEDLESKIEDLEFETEAIPSKGEYFVFNPGQLQVTDDRRNFKNRTLTFTVDEVYRGIKDFKETIDVFLTLSAREENTPAKRVVIHELTKLKSKYNITSVKYNYDDDDQLHRFAIYPKSLLTDEDFIDDLHEIAKLFFIVAKQENIYFVHHISFDDFEHECGVEEIII